MLLTPAQIRGTKRVDASHVYVRAWVSNLVVHIVNCIASIDVATVLQYCVSFERVMNNLDMCCLCSLTRTDCKNGLLPKISILE